jgi:hypothetical protein
VDPLGKYHCWEVVLWHGASDHPAGPSTDWLTATPPPERAISSDIHAPDVGVGTVATI